MRVGGGGEEGGGWHLSADVKSDHRTVAAVTAAASILRVRERGREREREKGSLAGRHGAEGRRVGQGLSGRAFGRGCAGDGVHFGV